jgi:hypothetical protein
VRDNQVPHGINKNGMKKGIMKRIGMAKRRKIEDSDSEIRTKQL